MPELGPFSPDEYIKAGSKEQVVELLRRYGDRARVIAGGTMIYELSKRGMLPNVQKLIDVEGLGLSYVKEERGWIRIGSMTRVSQLLDAAVLAREPYAVLHEAAMSIRPRQIRNMATVGGEVCGGVPFLDLPTALLVLDAALLITGPRGTKKMPLDGFYLDFFLTRLRPTEFLLEVLLPPMPSGRGAAFQKFERTAVDLALVNVAVSLTLGRDGACRDVRIAMGGARATMRLKRLEGMLEGRRLGDGLIDSLCAALDEEFKPISSVHASSRYKREMGKVLLREAIRTAHERAEGALHG